MNVKHRAADFALRGGAPLFAEPLHVGQLSFPPEEAFRAAFDGIFDRRYFTNHGPLVRELDERITRVLGVRHAISVVNATVALMVAARALDLSGEVVVPSFTFPATVQALTWAGVTPVFCDVDPSHHSITAELVEPLITGRTSAVAGVHLWGRPGDPDGLERLCRERGLRLFFDAAHAFGCRFGDRSAGRFGDLEVFSFHATKFVGAAEGGCVVTDDDALADRVRTARNFHVSETFVPMTHRMNGKMSEAQAAMALLSLDAMEEIRTHNRAVHAAYCQALDGVEGISLLRYDDLPLHNYQYATVELDPGRFGLTRDRLVEILLAEGVIARRYFSPGMHRHPSYADPCHLPRPLPVTERLCDTLLQLPTGSPITAGQAGAVGRLVADAGRCAGELA